MDDITKEKKEGVDWEYLTRAIQEKDSLEGKYYTSTYGLMGQMFSRMAKTIIEEVGKEKGEKILEKMVKDFGEERGRRIAQRVTSLGLPLTFKNFLIYTDLDSSKALEYIPRIEEGDLILEIKRCAFSEGPKEWDMMEYFNYYCQFIDVAIIRGYNPEIELEVPKNLSAGDGMCTLIYKVKE
jgi:hypothetical protein